MNLLKNYYSPLGAVVLLLTFAAVPVTSNALPEPASTKAGGDLEERGKIVLAIAYDRSGKVAECRLVRSNAPVELEASTVDYVRTHWNCPLFAGMKVTLPIVFEAGYGQMHWNGDFPLPPNPFPYDGHKYAMKLRLTFNNEGWVSHVQAEQTSGIQLADDETGAWIQAHWHHVAYANQNVDVPLEFARPPIPAPTVPHVAPKPKPPPEPVAIPAIRVQ